MKVSMDLTYDSPLWNLFSIVLLLSNYGQSNNIRGFWSFCVGGESNILDMNSNYINRNRSFLV